MAKRLALIALVGAMIITGACGTGSSEVDGVRAASVDDALPFATTTTTAAPPTTAAPITTTAPPTTTPPSTTAAPTTTPPTAPPTTAAPITAPPTTAEPVPVTAPPPATEAGVYYQNCSAAKAAGAAPVYRGDPGYAAHLDRDDDGIGCES